MTHPKLIVLIGLPGSGKSTWAAAQHATILSSDAMRLLLSGDENNQLIHARVFSTLRYLLKQRLELGATPTILDATNLRRKDRKPWLQLAARHHATVEAVFFDVPLATALARNASRARIVPPAAIERLAARLQPPSRDEGFARITSISA